MQHRDTWDIASCICSVPFGIFAIGTNDSLHAGRLHSHSGWRRATRHRVNYTIVIYTIVIYTITFGLHGHLRPDHLVHLPVHRGGFSSAARRIFLIISFFGLVLPRRAQQPHFSHHPLHDLLRGHPHLPLPQSSGCVVRGSRPHVRCVPAELEGDVALPLPEPLVTITTGICFHTALILR